MKRFLIILLAFVTITVTAQPNSEFIKARRTTWKKTALNMGISLASIALEMTGDALYDMGKEEGNLNKMQWGHALQATGYVTLLTIPLLDVSAKDIPVIAVNYICLRFATADMFYNATRGLPLGYVGRVSAYDNIVNQFPPHGLYWTKGIAFTFAFGINIKYW